MLSPPATDPHGTVLPQDLPDIRSYREGLPQTLDYQSFMEVEGSTYYWYWRNLLTLGNWAPCTLGSNLPLPMPKGWTSVGSYSLPPQDLDGNVTIPLAILIKPDSSTRHERHESCKRWYTHTTSVMRAAHATSKRGHNIDYTREESSYGSDREQYGYKDDKDSDNHGGYDHEGDHSYGYDDERYGKDYNCGKNEDEGASPHLVLLIRGSLLASEWAADSAYKQVQQTELGPGMISLGYAQIAQALWASGLGEAIHSEIRKGCRSLTIAGYSLGGAVGQLLAVQVEALLAATDPYPGSHKASPVTAVLFGSPSVADSAWAANFNRKINARNIAFQGDAVIRTPCEPSTVGCPSPPVSVDTTPGPWFYKRAGANIVYPAEQMPFNSVIDDAQKWTALTTVTGEQLCSPTFGQAAVAGHVCSYLCMTAQYVGEANNMCWLDATTQAPAGATQCNYPTGTRKS